MLIGNPNRLDNYIIIPFNLQEIGIYELPKIGDPKVIGECRLIGIVQLHREEIYLAHAQQLTKELNDLIIDHFYPRYHCGIKPQRLTEKVLTDFPDLKGRFINE